MSRVRSLDRLLFTRPFSRELVNNPSAPTLLPWMQEEMRLQQIEENMN